MTLKQRIESELKEAMRAGDAERRDVLRMLKSKILESEVQLRSKKGLDYQLDDAETIEVITHYAKQRRQSIEAYQQAGREDLASREQGELEILEKYLPRQLSRREIEEVVQEAIQQTGASSMRDLGTVMQAVMPQVKGSADGKLVSEVVRELLGKLG